MGIGLAALAIFVEYVLSLIHRKWNMKKIRFVRDTKVIEIKPKESENQLGKEK